MRKTVGILDDVEIYGRRLAGAINTRKNSNLRATFIADPSEVKDLAAADKIQILLVSETYAWNPEDATVPTYILISEQKADEVTGPGDARIYRYSQVTDIMDSLLSEVVEKKENVNERLIVVFSPDSVDTCVKFALELAGVASKAGKTLFLPFDNFYGKNERPGITELLYTGLGSREGLAELLDRARGPEYDSFGGPEHFSDLWQYTEGQMKSLLEAIVSAGYDHIVVAAGFMSDSIYLLFKRADAIYLPEADSARCRDFIRQMKASSDDDIVIKVRECL